MSPAFEPYDVAIAGAGISGMSCALALRRAGLRVVVLDSGDQAGGCIRSVRRESCIADGGPQTFVASAQFLDLVDSVECSDKLQRAVRGSGSMFLYSRGRLLPAPMSPLKFLTTPLLSAGAKLRLLAEPLVGARVGDPDESLADFARRRGGAEIVDALVRPLVNGVFAGDPERLSARSAFPVLVEYERRYTSVFIGAVSGRLLGARSLERSPLGDRAPAARIGKRTPVAFAGGNDVLVRALASNLAPDLRLRAPVTDLILRGAAIELAFAGPDAGSVVARHAVLALPADASGQLLSRLEPDAASALQSITHTPVLQVALSYPRDAVGVDLDGFGFLAGEESGLRILGCTWNSSMFPDRCPRDRVLLTAFLGGWADADIISLRDSEVVRMAHADLSRALDIRDVAPAVVAGFRWERAIPQYELGHADRLKTIAAGLSRLVQVSLIGNFLGGPSVADCVAKANEVAATVARRLHGM